MTRRCEAACKTHRNRYGSKATAYMEGQPVLSHWVCAECLPVCLCRVGWRGGGVHTSVFLETTWYETVCPLAHMAQPTGRTIEEREHPPAPVPTRKPPLCARTFCAQTHNFLQIPHTCIYTLIKPRALHLVLVLSNFSPIAEVPHPPISLAKVNRLVVFTSSIHSSRGLSNKPWG